MKEGPSRSAIRCADLKPPQAAVVKSNGGERCGKVGTRTRQARLREALVGGQLRFCARSAWGAALNLHEPYNDTGNRSPLAHLSNYSPSTSGPIQSLLPPGF